MKSLKPYIIIIIILIIFFCVMYFSFGRENIKQNNYTTSIIVGENTMWNYSDRKWMNITTSSTIDKLNWQMFKVFVDNKESGEYYLWHDDKWYLFDKDKKAFNVDGNLLAYKANYDIDVVDFSLEDIDDFTYVYKVMEENNLNKASKFTISKMVKLDIDKDGITENFYLISNVFALDFNPSTIFSIVFMEKEGNTYPIYTDVQENNGNNGCKPYFNAFLDTNNDGVYEMILSCGRYSNLGVVDMLYKFENNSFKIAISNQ